MQRFFAFFFFVIMMLNLAVPLLELLGNRALVLVELTTDDMDEESKKETEKEKEAISFSQQNTVQRCIDAFQRLNKSKFSEAHLPVTEWHASLPDIPPEV